MGIRKQLVTRLLRLEELRYGQQLGAIRHQLHALEKQDQLMDTLDKLASAAVVGHRPVQDSHGAGTCSGLQIANRGMFHDHLLHSWQQCARNRTRQMDIIRVLSEDCAAQTERLKRLRQRYNNRCN